MVAINKLGEGNGGKPPEQVLEWCRNIVRIIADGGNWGIPRSGTTFMVDHKQKRLVLLIPGNDDDADFNATKHVFSYIGWDVVKKDDNDESAQEN